MRTIDEKENYTMGEPKEPYELAVYKRLGLSSKKAKTISAIIADIPLDRLEQICQAERDGKLEIKPGRPMKNGYTVHFGRVVRVGHWRSASNPTEIWARGKDFQGIVGAVYATREEAEKALKEME